MTDLSPSVLALVEAHRSGVSLTRLPVEPASLSDCFAIQDRVASCLGAQIGGWKVGLPQAQGPYRAPLYRSGLMPSPAIISQRNRSQFGFEAEIVFRFGRALAERDRPYEVEDIVPAISSAHAAIELIESRYGEAVPYLSRLADNQTHGGLVFGPSANDWTKLDLAHLPVRVEIDGVEVSRAIGGNPSGNPLDPVVWLVNHLAEHRGGIQAGAYVTTGSTTGHETAHPNASVKVTFDGLGDATIRFVD